LRSNVNRSAAVTWQSLQEIVSKRKVFRFYLQPTETPAISTREDAPEVSTSRQIPTLVKIEVWKRDQGRCVLCGATDNLPFDHEVPFSKGGSSITPENVKLLCARHNLQKSNKIIALGPLLRTLAAMTFASLVQRGMTSLTQTPTFPGRRRID